MITGFSLRYDELKDILRTLRNSQKIKDIAKVQTGQWIDTVYQLLSFIIIIIY